MGIFLKAAALPTAIFGAMLAPRGREVEALIDATLSFIDDGMLPLDRKSEDGRNASLGAFEEEEVSEAGFMLLELAEISLLDMLTCLLRTLPDSVLYLTAVVCRLILFCVQERKTATIKGSLAMYI